MAATKAGGAECSTLERSAKDIYARLAASIVHCAIGRNCGIVRAYLNKNRIVQEGGLMQGCGSTCLMGLYSGDKAFAANASSLPRYSARVCAWEFNFAFLTRASSLFRRRTARGREFTAV